MTATPSEDLTPHDLDQALLVLVVRRGGTAYMTVATDVDDADLSAWMHGAADRVAAGEHRQACADCAAGVLHEHGPAR